MGQASKTDQKWPPKKPGHGVWRDFERMRRQAEWHNAFYASVPQRQPPSRQVRRRLALKAKKATA